MTEDPEQLAEAFAQSSCRNNHDPQFIEWTERTWLAGYGDGKKASLSNLQRVEREKEEQKGFAEDWHRSVEIIATVMGLSPALGSSESRSAIVEHYVALEREKQALEAQLKAAREAQTWIPVSPDTLPDVEKRVWCFSKKFGVTKGFRENWFGERLSWETDAERDQALTDVTHWMEMPLPEPPAASLQESETT